MKYFFSILLSTGFFFIPPAKAETLFKCEPLKGYSYYGSFVENVKSGFASDGYSTLGGNIELQRIDEKFDVLWSSSSLKNDGLTIRNVSIWKNSILISMSKNHNIEEFQFVHEAEGKKLIWTRHFEGPAFAKVSLMIADCE